MPDLDGALAGRVPAGSSLADMSRAPQPRPEAMSVVGDAALDSIVRLSSSISRPAITRRLRAKQEAFWLLLADVGLVDSSASPTSARSAVVPRAPRPAAIPAPGSAGVPAPPPASREPDPASVAAITNEPAAPPPPAPVVPAPAAGTPAPRAAAQRAAAPTARASNPGTISRDLAAQIRSYLSSVLPVERFGTLELGGERGGRSITVTVRLRARGTVRSSWSRQGVGQWAAAVGSATSQMNVSAFVLGRGAGDEWVTFDGRPYDATSRQAIDRNVRIRLTGTRIDRGVDG